MEAPRTLGSHCLDMKSNDHAAYGRSDIRTYRRCSGQMEDSSPRPPVVGANSHPPGDAQERRIRYAEIPAQRAQSCTESQRDFDSKSQWCSTPPKTWIADHGWACVANASLPIVQASVYYCASNDLAAFGRVMHTITTRYQTMSSLQRTAQQSKLLCRT
ncbi:hypothetical protein P153DRAFT_358632 [Dothidotthia symphoricarpi CBS 119687]|uniref:Uncharacterized protein n=1 Tax=Dothidotthia symphoricarpi CBS 119687 TaxID=1392245 RepID=A0A6A6A9N6_9PLEO|nr:uncharacterized protein P153DRAFT_358632 [Dothidotthia symphoricarpi CBS 119687]KAF2127794.1 hypothetical protein P153DRAFT_358632 [Dothidotthia symphoricarpi CBS 119687]